MKNFFAGALLCALMLSLFGISASALTAEDLGSVAGCPGFFCCEPSEFSPVGTVKIEWDPDAAKKLDLTDGSMADWESAGYSETLIDHTNMVSWMGDSDSLPENWHIRAYFAADSDNVYFGFSVTDVTLALGSGDSYDGDVIQLSLDFGRRLGDQVDDDRDALLFPKNVFYSFSCNGDGAPIAIMRQESDQDGWLTEEDGVRGSTFTTSNGWCAEFSMSYDRLYEDYVWKDWDEDGKVYVGTNDSLPFKLGCCLYYLDRAKTAGEVNWAAGTTNGILYADGTPCLSWTVYDNGLQLELDYVEGMVINSRGVVVLDPVEETTENLTMPETETYVEYPTEPLETDSADLPIVLPPETSPAWVTASPEVDGTVAADNKAEEIDAILAKYGCTAVLGMGGMIALPILAAAVYICRKKQ